MMSFSTFSICKTKWESPFLVPDFIRVISLGHGMKHQLCATIEYQFQEYTIDIVKRVLLLIQVPESFAIILARLLEHFSTVITSMECFYSEID